MVKITYLLTLWCWVLLEQLTGLQLVKKFPAFHGTRRFITALTNLRHLSLSWPSPIQSIYPHPTSWRSVLILSTHLCLGLPSGLLPSGFPTKTLHTPFSPIRATCPAHLILLEFITRTILGEEHKSFSSSLCNLLHSPVTSSFLGSNILLNTMFSNTLLNSKTFRDYEVPKYLAPKSSSCSFWSQHFSFNCPTIIVIQTKMHRSPCAHHTYWRVEVQLHSHSTSSLAAS